MTDEVVSGELVVPAPLTGRIARAAEVAAFRNPDEQYSDAAKELIDEGVSANTRAAMLHCAWRYVQWCGQTGREHLPATPATVVDFILHLGRMPGRYNGVDTDGTVLPFRPLAPETVRMYLKMISRAHRMARRPEQDAQGNYLYGYVSPTGHPDVQAAFRGYTRRWLKAGHRPDVASDLTPEELLKLIATLDMGSVRGVRDAALFSVAYDAGLRKEEPGSLLIEDVEFSTTSDGVPLLILKLPYSKTDQAGQGAEIVLHGHPPEFAASDPVLRVRKLLDVMAGCGFTRGPLFRQVSGVNRRGDGSFSGGFVDKAINGRSLEYAVEVAGVSAGLINPAAPRRQRRHLVVHSLRAGAVTAAAEQEADTPEIALHFRFSPQSPTPNRYANRGKRRRRTNPSRRIWAARPIADGGAGGMSSSS